MAKGLVRDAAGRYHSPDGRFAVEHEGTSWYLRDTSLTDELGLPRIQGPFPTLDAVSEAIASAAPAPKATSHRRNRSR